MSRKWLSSIKDHVNILEVLSEYNKENTFKITVHGYKWFS